MSKEFKLGKNSIVAMHEKRTLSFRIFNRMMNGVFIFLYKIYLLPLFGIGNKMILVHTIGRKTGKKRTTPTLIFTFYTGKFTLYIARGMKAHWLKNILATEDHIFKIQKGFRTWKVKGTLVEDSEEKFKHLKFYFEELPEAETIFGYNKDKHGDVFEQEEFLKILNIIEFIQLIPVMDF
ncbi:MAG: nitroreductase/quinone reductase family protein [Candidatus Heimdallarchaeaceae archaeon]